MAKKKQLAAASSQPPVASSPQLSERQRALRVLRSQGKAVGCFDSLPPAMQTALAEFCTPTGELVPGIVEGVQTLFADYYAAQKAVVDEDAG